MPAAADPPRRRNDAERNAERILDAAIDLLAERPTASMAEVATAAGLVRATVYGHYPTRVALLDAITARALADALAALDEARLDEGPAADAVPRLAAAAWSVGTRYLIVTEATLRTLGVTRYRARNSPVRADVRMLVERGVREGAFRADLSPAWAAQVFESLVFGTYFAVGAGELPADDAAAELARTFLALLAA